MAWIAATDVSGITHCSPAAATLPVDGMAWMYLLMCIFHASPWLKLASARLRPSTHYNPN
jgi:hypothetical protein